MIELMNKSPIYNLATLSKGMTLPMKLTDYFSPIFNTPKYPLLYLFSNVLLT